MLPEIQIRVNDYFTLISNEIRNLNPTQQGRVIFDFKNKNSITVWEWVDKAGIAKRLSTPTTTWFIDWTYIIDETLDADLKLADRSITNAKIKLSALTWELIALWTITETLIADNAITTWKINANAITSAKIWAGEIKAINMITDQAVITWSAQIQDAIIVEAKIWALAVTTAKIWALAVTNAKINDVSVAKLTAWTINSKEITVSGTWWIRSSNYSSGSAWFSIDSDWDAEFNSVTVRWIISAGTISSSWYLQVGDYVYDSEAIKIYVSTKPRIEFRYDYGSVGYLQWWNYTGTIGWTSVNIDSIKASWTFLVWQDLVVADDIVVVDDWLIWWDFYVHWTMGVTSSWLIKLPVWSNKYA